MEQSIHVHNLCKAYDDRNALNGISFCVNKGELFAFLGPNGAGKSTTIGILSTLMTADRGEVYIEQNRLGNDDAAIRRKIGIVFQNSVLDASLSVQQNLILRCGLYGLYGKQARERVKALYDLCHIEDIRKQRVNTLSGGQRRRVDIARAMISDPSILILDEPTTGLDPKARKEVWDNILQLQSTYGKTLFMTTHYMEEAEKADHICMIQKGEILVDATTSELMQDMGRDQLYLYTDVKQNVSRMLQQHHIKHHIEIGYIQIPVLNFFQMMSVLRKCEPYIHHIEVKKQSMEDIYLEVIKEDV